MAAAIKEEFDLDAELIESKGGIYDVAVDGTIVFSKHKLGRFPNDDNEVLDAVHAVKK